MFQQGASGQVRYRGACLFSARAAAAANMRDCLRFESPPKLSSGTSNSVLVSPFPPNTGCRHTRSLVFSQLGSSPPERSPLPARHSLRASPGSGSSNLPEHRTAARHSTASWQPELARDPLRIAKRPTHSSVVLLTSWHRGIRVLFSRLVKKSAACAYGASSTVEILRSHSMPCKREAHYTRCQGDVCEMCPAMRRHWAPSDPCEAQVCVPEGIATSGAEAGACSRRTEDSVFLDSSMCTLNPAPPHPALPCSTPPQSHTCAHAIFRSPAAAA